jgi:nucleoside-diphosphate-sugar epimerase
MKVMLTGASGFIGESVLYELLRRQHHLIALVRSPAPPRWFELGNLEVMQADLLQPQLLDFRGKDIDVVLHLAAVTRRSSTQQFEETVTGTANLLSAALRAGIRRIVGISSIAVLDYRSVRPMTVIDEQVAIADGAGPCDYASSKIQQERLFTAFARIGDNACVVLRPGLVYDESRLATAYAGVCAAGFCLLANHRGKIPTIEVHRLASAIANAAECHLDRCEVIHVVDDDLPGQSSYIAALKRRGLLPRVRVAVPWRVLQALSYFAATVFTMLGRRHKLPEVLQPKDFSRRVKPFVYSNAKAKRLLDWIPGREFA